ncbi:lipoprotein insertase outer membrane protein LolB [Stenotrophomonas rhizophila]|uniref:lipoprotein insertase outer membrane protein LolB n=1 Tax=Stenotrophomonas rhizophila TaxID=216778 RepID=UPI001E2EB050|nr:lipoprotein insertase outer membrane protein LolB [Stenotrophomonas rhizophila]MCC7634718.1 lipoprotein localization protein LolB [Stenotrophomonas rhizophila]MCC7664910.1 lipoprotein localization protein LolB [Stenotrophomonas rhizophila]
MNMLSLKTAGALAMALSLSACVSLGERKAPAAPVVVSTVSAAAQQAEAARVAALQAQPQWSFQGRVAINKGRNGGNGRIDWQQQSRQYVVELSAPVTRQSWKLTGDSHHEGGRLEGLDGGPREGEDAQQVLLEATGWDIPVNQLPAWVRGLVADDAAPAEQVERDGEGRPRRVRQMGWDIQYLDWYPAEGGRPVLPRRIEAVNGDAKVRLVVDSWVLGGP